MKTLTKQILSVALAFCICLTMLPAMIMKADAADSISMMVSYAQARVGKTGQELGYNDQWCAFFVSDCAVYAGQTKAIPRNGNAHNLYFAVLNAGGKVVSAPQKGDLVFYNCSACDTNNDGIAIMHVGLVENENYSIEGNLGPSGSTLYTRKVVRKGLNESYSHGSGHNTGNYVKRIYVRPAYDGGTGEHTCNKGTYVYYEAAHPHYKCYECSICGTVWRNTAEPTIVSSCTSCVPEKVSDSRYSAFLPIASYTRDTGNITVYDSSGTVYSNRYISGSTDLCLILEIYTDGWCKVKYPSSAESSGYFTAYVPFSTFALSASPSSWTCTGNYTTYRRSDLSETMHTVNNGDSCLVVGTSGGLKQIIHPTPVNGQTCFMMGWVKEPKTHTHSYTGNRVYEIEHPHRISQRCVDYETCGGYIWTDEYYELKTCEQCWHATFNIGTSSISVKVGESKTVSASLSGCLPDSAVMYRTFSPDNNVVEVTIKNQQATFTGLKAGTTNFSMTVYSDSSKSRVIGTITIPVTVTAQAYTVSYNANGGSGAPGNQTKTHGVALPLSSTVPTRFGYNFMGWAKTSSATKADCQPGESYTSNSDITLYAVWEEAVSLSGYTTADITYPGVGVYYKLTPDRTTSYALLGSGYANLENANCQITLFNSNGTKIETSSASTSAGECSLYYDLNSGSTYYIYVSLTDSAAAGGVDILVCPGYKVIYHANGGSGAPAADYCYDSAIELSGSKPTRTGYTFLGWAESSAATQAAYQPGDRYITNQDITLYAIWEKGCPDNHNYSYKVTKEPTVDATGILTGTCTKCSSTTMVTLPKLNTTDYTYSVIKEPNYTATGTGRYTWKNTTYGTYYFDVTLDKLTAAMTKIEIASNPTKTVYQIGESLDTTGLSLKATYSDGSTKTITSGFTTSGFSSTTAGTKTVTVTYGGKSTTFTVTVQAATSETDAKIVVENKTAAAGETVAVTIAVKNNPGIASLKLKVAFDPMLTLTGVTYNTSIGGQFQQPQKMESPVTLNWFNGTADSEGDWVYATLTFVVSDSAEGGSSAGISVTYNPDDVYDITETNIPFAIVNGSITIVDYIPGDINGDGVVNNKDVTRLFQYLSDWNVSVNEPAMDVNGDGSINNKDLTRLFQYLSDWDVSIQ